MTKRKETPASFVPGWPSLDVNSSAHAAAVERQLIDHPRARHARDRFERVDQAFLKRHKRFRSDDPPGRTELKRQEIGGIEASWDATEIAKMHDEDDGHREQRECERDLRDDQCLRHLANRTPCRRAYTLGEHRIWRSAHRLPERAQGWRARLRQRPSRSQTRGPSSQCSVHRRTARTSEPATTMSADEHDAQPDACCRANQRHDGTLGEISKRQVRATGPERDSNRRFTGSRDRPREQQRRDVRARDQQKQAGSAEQQQQRRLQVGERLPSQAHSDCRVHDDATRDRRARCLPQRAQRPPAPVAQRRPACAWRSRNRLPCSGRCPFPVGSRAIQISNGRRPVVVPNTGNSNSLGITPVIVN